MNRSKSFLLAVLAGLMLGTTGCGSFFAHRMAQAPNSYPTWLAPKARVQLGYNAGFLTNFPTHYVMVPQPKARLPYRIVEPADYNVRVNATNWLAHGQKQYDFSFKATLPAETNAWSIAPRGTVVLLHGYGVGMFAMAPWALRLAQEGWRCVLIDLRGHGHATGKQIYFGLQETHDLSDLLDELARNGKLAGPVSVMGESYGASLALRWKTLDPRVGQVVAIAPYAELATAVLNISDDYAPWVPKMFLKAGLNKLPALLDQPRAELDTVTVLARKPVMALFIAAADDKVAPPADVNRLESLAEPGSKLIVVPHATHEAVTYCFGDLLTPVVDWLSHPQVFQARSGG